MAAITKHPVTLRAIELLLCAWVVAAQIYYLSQFRPLVELFLHKVLHRG